MESEVSNILILLIVGTSVVLLLAGSIILFVVYYQKRMLQNKVSTQALESGYQKQLLQSTIDSQEKERKRIASDLHDGVGAILSAAKLNLNMLKNGTIPKEEFSAALSDTNAMIDETIETVRRISKDLLPASLEAFGLSRAVQELCEKLDNPGTKVIYQEKSKSRSLPKQDELLIFRMIQELVNNAIKHARASQITVSIDWRAPMTVLVRDNGQGFNLEEIRKKVNKGVGLYNIENRASLIGGEIGFESEPGEGAVVVLKLKE